MIGKETFIPYENRIKARQNVPFAESAIGVFFLLRQTRISRGADQKIVELLFL